MTRRRRQTGASRQREIVWIFKAPALSVKRDIPMDIGRNRALRSAETRDRLQYEL